MNKTKENLLIGKESDEQEVTLMESDNEVSSDILFEDTSKRSENVKHFRMKNGQYMAAVYDRPVHSFDKATGKFLDIAHRFNEKDDCYEAETDRFKARFPKKEGKRKFVTMEKDGRSVSWRFIPSTDSHKKRPEAAIHKHERRSLMELPSFPTLKYEKTESRTDLEYGITDRGVKENIILSKRPKSTVFRFELKLDGLHAVPAEDRSIVSFIKKDESEETLMVMPPIRMIDGAGVVSEAAHYELNEEEDMTVLSIVVDPEWLFADSRIYPVTIDPQLSVLHTDDSQPLSFVTIRSDNSKLSSNSVNRVGFERNGTENRMYAKYSIPSLPAGYRLVEATLELNRHTRSGEDREYDVCNVSTSWDYDSLTWANRPDANESRIMGTIGSDDNNKVQINITKEIRRFISQREIGIAIKAHGDIQTSSYSLNNIALYNCNSGLPVCTPGSSSSGGNTGSSSSCNPGSSGNNTGSSSDCNPGSSSGGNSGSSSGCNPGSSSGCTPGSSSDCNPGSSSGGGQGGSSGSCHTCSNCEGYIDFYSSLSTTNSPRIKIKYTLVDEYVDHQKTETFDAGRAGSGAVNLFTGKLSFTHVDASTSSVRLPLSFSHVYRSDYIEAGVSGKTYGKGWIFSPVQKLTESSSDEICATYCDAAGRKHYFKNETSSEENAETICSDTAGMGLTFKKETREVVDEKGNTLSFDKSGRLIQIANAYNATNKFTYANNLLVSATDSISREATMTYNNNDKLESVTYMGRKTKFEYQGDLLTSITYPDGQKTAFGYSDSGYLNTITDQTGIQYTIKYDSSNRIISISKTGTMRVSATGATACNTDGGGTTFEYRERSTAVKDNLTNIKQVYYFDDTGRVTSSYEDLTENHSLKAGELTVTDLAEYDIVKNNKTKTNTEGRYPSIKVGMSGNEVMYPNYLKNGSFNDDSTGTLNPNGWKVLRVYCNEDGVSEEGSVSGYHSYKFDNTTARGRRNKYLEQTTSLSGCGIKGNMLIASAWVKASDPIGHLTESSSTKFELYAKVTYEDGTTLEKTAMYDCGCTDWQYTAVPLELVTETGAKRVPASATVRIDFSGNNGTCLVSNVRLTEARGSFTKITYGNFEIPKPIDKAQHLTRKVYTTDGLRGMLVYYDENSDAVVTIEYDENSQSVTSYAIYNEKHQAVKTQDYRGIVTQNTYDSYGNVTIATWYHKDSPDNKMHKRVVYTSGGRKLREYMELHDKHGVIYHYDNDNVEYRIAPNGQRYDYTYNKNNQMTSVSARIECNSNDPKNLFSYNKGYLTEVEHNGFLFNFDYDELGRNSKISVGGKSLISLAYTLGETSTTTSEFANGYTTIVTTDSRGNPIKKSYNGTTVSEAEYDNQGNIVKLLDKLRNICYNYTYNKDGNVSRIEERNIDTGELLGSRAFTYDDGLRQASKVDSFTGYTYSPIYEHVGSLIYPDDAIVGVRLNGKFTDEFVKDDLGRKNVRKLTLSGKTSPLMTNCYDYLKSDSGFETNCVGTLTHTVNGKQTEKLSYTYDIHGNIETISKDGELIAKYEYDVQNRLIREDDYQNEISYTWAYNAGGNITEKCTYNLNRDGSQGEFEGSDSYIYDSVWKDRLISYKEDTNFKYDALGNPTKYRGHNLTWTNVRSLASYDDNKFFYGANGIRYKKNNTTYTLDGTRIIRETNGAKTLTYFYGTDGVIGFQYNNVKYFYRKNLQGDVTAIYDENGVLQATYAYDAWGMVTVTDVTTAKIGTLNPFRYRSYYYDIETGLYYLETRYYDPVVGRFINSDSLEYLGKGAELSNYNLFVYCDNNPIMGYDPAGTVNWLGVIAGIGQIVIGVAIICLGAYVESPEIIEMGVAVTTTGGVTTYAAATESVMVVDVSGAYQLDSVYGKAGASVVIDFSKSEAYFYPHVGGGIGFGENGFSASYSVGLVYNYENPEDYAMYFIDANLGYIDFCRNPLASFDSSTKAVSASFPIIGSGFSASYGLDYYFSPKKILEW